MKYAFSLETVNMLTSGPGVFTRQSKSFWTDYMKYAAAVGFSGIELPFNCFHSDPMAFETGRSGIPCSELAIREKYGGPEHFIFFIKEIGISDGIVDIHVSTQDAMLELLACGKRREEYYPLAEELLSRALGHAAGLNADCLIVSPSPELGWLYRVFGEDLSAFEEQTADMLEKLTKEAGKTGIRIAVKNEFWSFFRGMKMNGLLQRVPELLFSPDPAHFHIEGRNAAEAFSEHADRLLCVRMNDTAFGDIFDNYKKINAELPTEGPQKIFTDCGEGELDLKGLIRGLETAGYDGWIICENRRTSDVYKGLLKLGWFVRYGLNEGK